ncbi:hypothetical protein CKY04_22470 [Photorhabdus sp. S8-52]|nr:hypothetical protein CKY05_22450 [Photorhabdus sp. S10-54]RAW96661.1 hypothetical protein CKY04_22470 [Photorhabdus sp. S8-52]
MLMLAPLVSSADSPNDNEVGAYILALNTMSPIMAKYTVYYKEAVEQSCNASGADSTGFTNVVQALVSGETVDKMGLDGNALQDTLKAVGCSISCTDLNAPFKTILSDESFKKKHGHLSKALQTWNEVVISK